LSVTDNAGDAVFLHVPASSERQECLNKTGLRREQLEILKHLDVYISMCIVVLFHTVSGYTFTFTSYFISDYHIKTKQNTFLIYSLLSSHKKRMCERL